MRKFLESDDVELRLIRDQIRAGVEAAAACAFIAAVFLLFGVGLQ